MKTKQLNMKEMKQVRGGFWWFGPLIAAKWAATAGAVGAKASC